jgi:hypothetical protein
MKALSTTALLVCLGLSASAQTATTTEDLVKQVLAGLELNSHTALERLTINEAEYRKYIWPTISTNNPGARFEKYFAMYQKASNDALAAAIKEHNGQKLQFVKVTAGQPIRQGKGYRLSSTVDHRSHSGWNREDDQIGWRRTGVQRHLQGIYVFCPWG